MVGTIILFTKEMYENKNKNFSLSGVFSMVGQGFLLFLFGLSESPLSAFGTPNIMNDPPGSRIFTSSIDNSKPL